MRFVAPVCMGLVLVSGIASTILWQELRTDRQLIEDLRGQLATANAALEARSRAQPVAEAMPQPAVELNPASAAGAPIAAAPAKPSRDAAAVALVAEYAKRAKTLMGDSEYRKARLAELRNELKVRYVGLAMYLGISEQQADALINVLAETQLSQMAQSAELMANGTAPDPAAMAEMTRIQQALEQRQKDALVAMLGTARFEQFQEYEHTQPSRTRVGNLTTLLARSGRPLTNVQTQSLTAVMVAEQKRRESEAKALADAGQTSPLSQADREVETNRRILENAAKFLDTQQLELLRGRFQQRAVIDRTSEQVQQREREVLQTAPGQ